MNEIAKLTGNHMHRSGNVCSERECQYAPRIHNGKTLCRCGNYPRTDIQGFCTVCGAGFMADWEWEDVTGRAGFVESDSLASDDAIKALSDRIMNGPDASVTVTVHTLSGESFPIPNVREDSLGMETRNGVPLLVFERPGTDVLGYVPNVAYWVTVTETA